MHARKWLLVIGALAAFGALAASPSPGSAQPASVQAQSLFEEGRRLMKDGKFAEACTAFEASQKLDPAVTTLLNLADCREQNRQLATAWGLFVDANRIARAAGNAKLVNVATSHAKKLEPRLSWLTISVPPDRQVPGLTVLRDKTPVDPVSWNHALPIDGGSYTITARAPGRESWSVTRTIKVEGDNQKIEIPRLAEPKPAEPKPAAPVASRPRPVTPPATTSPAGPAGRPDVPPAAGGTRSPGAVAGGAPAEHPAPPTAVAGSGEDPSGESSPAALSDQWPARLRAAPIGFGIGAVALGGAALGFHLWGNSLHEEALKLNTAATRSEAEKKYDAATTRRYLAQGFGVAAVGCAGLAVYFYLSGRESRPPTAAIAPMVSPDLAGLAVAGRW